jgi:hypothetical protein
MNATELDTLQERACTGKSKMGPVAARNAAASMRLNGEDVQPYRCPFCACWHVGHTMAWEGVEHLAEALRFRAHPEGPHVVREAG